MPPSSTPAATIRTQVLLPLRFADGYSTTARVFSFDGLLDGQESLAFGLGDRAAALTSGEPRRVPLVRLSNNPDKASQLRRFGMNVASRVPTGVYLSDANARYLATKADRGEHTLDLPRSAG